MKVNQAMTNPTSIKGNTVTVINRQAQPINEVDKDMAESILINGYGHLVTTNDIVVYGGYLVTIEDDETIGIFDTEDGAYDYVRKLEEDGENPDVLRVITLAEGLAKKLL